MKSNASTEALFFCLINPLIRVMSTRLPQPFRYRGHWRAQVTLKNGERPSEEVGAHQLLDQLELAIAQLRPLFLLVLGWQGRLPFRPLSQISEPGMHE